LAKASSVGAKTVNGPLPLSVSTRPAACSAVARVLNWPAATAVSTMSLAWAAKEAAAGGGDQQLLHGSILSLGVEGREG
jgi:hypothetical protein